MLENKFKDSHKDNTIIIMITKINKPLVGKRLSFSKTIRKQCTKTDKEVISNGKERKVLKKPLSKSKETGQQSMKWAKTYLKN